MEKVLELYHKYFSTEYQFCLKIIRFYLAILWINAPKTKFTEPVFPASCACQIKANSHAAICRRDLGGSKFDRTKPARFSERSKEKQNK